MTQILGQLHFTERLGLRVRIGNLKALNVTSLAVVCNSSVCLAASKGIQEIKLDQGSSDTRVCGISAAGLLLTYGTNLPVNVYDSTTFLVKNK